MSLRSLMSAGALALTLVVTLTPAAAIGQAPDVLLHESFAEGLAGRWRVVRLGNGTGAGSARVARDGVDAAHSIQVETAGSFYGVAMTSDFDPGAYSYMSWLWRVTKLPQGADIASKRADDAAARLYVIFGARSLLHPFATTALVYVWDARYPVGSVMPNPYAPDREKAIVLESGPARLGQWMPERVNLAADYARAFSRPPGLVKALMFAGDSDNTNSATASYLTNLTISGAELRPTGAQSER